jgi:hypothetical protein
VAVENAEGGHESQHHDVRMPALSKARRGTPTERNGGLLIDDDKDP